MVTAAGTYGKRFVQAESDGLWQVFVTSVEREAFCFRYIAARQIDPREEKARKVKIMQVCARVGLDHRHESF